jgi:hypothetical protein
VNPLNFLIRKLAGDHSDQWVALLTDKFGFDADQAGRFVPGVLTRVTELLCGGGLDLSSGLKASALLAKLDVKALAEQADVDFYNAKAGLIGLLPNMTETLLEEAGGLQGLASMVGGSDAPSLFGKTGDLLGR